MIKHALLNPTSIGAVTASSPALVQSMIRPVDDSHSLIVELGAGKGTITKELANKLHKDKRIISIEIDQSLAEIALQKVSSNVEIIVDSALNLKQHVEPKSVDCIVGSLPLTLFSSRDLDELFKAISSSLSDNGIFVFYLYKTGAWMPQYRRVMKAAHTHFNQVSRTKTTWLSIPPANVYLCS